MKKSNVPHLYSLGIYDVIMDFKILDDMIFKCSKCNKQIKNLVCYFKEYILDILENMF